MRKYVLEVDEEEEGHIEIFEINIEIFLSSLDARDMIKIKQAINDNKEIRISKITSKDLKEAEIRGNELA